MEEGDLMDRVPVLLERDRQYYEVSKVCIFVNCMLTLKRIICKITISLSLAIPNCPTRIHLPGSCWWYFRFSALCIICIGKNGRMVGRRILCRVQEKLWAFALE